MRTILSFFVLPVTGFLVTLVWRSRRCVANEVTMIRNIGAPHRHARASVAQSRAAQSRAVPSRVARWRANRRHGSPLL